MKEKNIFIRFTMQRNARPDRYIGIVEFLYVT